MINIKSNLKRTARNLYHIFRPAQPDIGVVYWEKRAKKLGKRSVLDVRHSEDEIDGVTEMQKEILFPLLQKQLKGNEKTILDLGCGPGRFTPALAELIGGTAIGTEPVKYLLELAPDHPSVSYKTMKEGLIPMENQSVDVVWICIVLGGITEDGVLRDTVLEIKRILKPKGLVFLAENTTQREDHDNWKYRSFEEYRSLLDFVDLKLLSHYIDIDERISVMAGRPRD